MRLAEKLLSRAGKAPSAGADRDPPAARAITAPPKASEADAGGVLTFGDVASAREGARGSDAATEAAARWSAGAVKRVGSIKFAAPKRGAPRGAPDETGDGAAKRVRGEPRGAKHVDFPADWTLKTHVKFTSTAPLRWAAASSGGPEASDGGVRAFVGARARADPDRPPRLDRDGDDSNQADEKNENDVLSSRERVCRALCAWTYPADPMEPELIAALRRAPGSAGKAWLERRLDDGWREALLGAYAALRVGDCPFFYVVFPERVALFCAPFSASGAGAGAGPVASAANERDAKMKTHDSKQTRDDENKNGKGAEGFAVVTEASVGKFRDALVAARVPHVCVGADPLARSKRAGRAGFTGLSKRAGADGDGRGYGGAYGHGIPLEEWAQEDFEEAYKDEEDFQALDAHGKPLVRSPERLARRNGVRLMERDARAAERAVIVRGAAAVHELVCLMTEAAATGGDPAGAASAARDAPLIMAPAPFAGASLRRVDLRVSRAETTYEIGDEPKSPPPPREEARAGEKRKKNAVKRRVYVAECGSGSGAMPIPPWCVSRLAEALCDEQAENVVGSFKTLGLSAALNAAVAAAAFRFSGNGTSAEDVSLRHAPDELDELDELDIGGAFTARERKRIRSSSRLGAGGVERVERADGTWYVNPEPSGNAR
jgi:F-box protein 18 (helicase)